MTFEIFRTLEAPIAIRTITVVPRASGLHIHKQSTPELAYVSSSYSVWGIKHPFKYFTFLVLGEFFQGAKNVNPDAHSQALLVILEPVTEPYTCQ